MTDGTVIRASGIMENGQYGPTLDLDELYDAIMATPTARNKIEEAMLNGSGGPFPTLGLPPSLAKHPEDLSQMRWGIVWPSESALDKEEQHHVAKLKTAMRDLIERRCQQMNIKEPPEFRYEPGWDVAKFLWSNGLNIYDMDLKTVPYYLCLVGSPKMIPWEFQQYLDVRYAVGRLWFDEPLDCELYASHLLAYETTKSPAPSVREVLFVGTRHQNDTVTQKCATRLVQPLHDWLESDGEFSAYETSLLLGDDANGAATKTNVLQRLRGHDLLGSPKRLPGLLFSAGHGLEYDLPSAEQVTKQGAPIFGEWPGGLAPVKADYYLTGAELEADLNLTGMLAFCFACFSAGTPLHPDWELPPRLIGALLGPRKIAHRPFVATLPQKMLARGALAFIGHVSRTWESSFLGVGPVCTQLSWFRETIGELLRGRPVGHATAYQNSQWPELSALLEAWKKGGTKTKHEIASLWLARNDGQGYVVLGDPAARIRFDS